MMIVIMKLSPLHQQIIKWASDKFPKLGTVVESKNPPGIKFEDKNQAVDFMAAISWDYQTDGLLMGFCAGRIKSRKYESLIEESSFLYDEIRKQIK